MGGLIAHQKVNLFNLLQLFESNNILSLNSAQVVEKYPGTPMFQSFINLWNNLPVTCVVDDLVIVMHGGLFRFGDLLL
jgi:hypothetical protein